MNWIDTIRHEGNCCDVRWRATACCRQRRMALQCVADTGWSQVMSGQTASDVGGSRWTLWGVVSRWLYLSIRYGRGIPHQITW